MLLAVPSAVDVVQPNELDSLVLWLKTDAGITDSIGQVKTWADQSGNGNDFSQPVISNRPDYGTNTLNGFNSITFDESQADKLNSSLTNLELFDAATLSNTTFFAVIQVTSISGNTLINDQASPNPRYGIFPDYSGTTYVQIKNAISKTLGFTTPSIMTVYRDSPNATLACRKNGVLEMSNASSLGPFTGTSRVMTLGARSSTDLVECLDGDVYEVIIYNRKLSPSEILSVESYLNNKYSIY